MIILVGVYILRYLYIFIYIYMNAMRVAYCHRIGIAMCHLSVQPLITENATNGQYDSE